MKRARLHLFWRAAIAIAVACGYATVSVTVTESVHQAVAETITGALRGQLGSSWQFGVGIAIAWFLPVLLIAFAVYVSFFPQLVAGPIERSTTLLPQFHETHRFDYDRTVNGLRLIYGAYSRRLSSPTIWPPLSRRFTATRVNTMAPYR